MIKTLSPMLGQQNTENESLSLKETSRQSEM